MLEIAGGIVIAVLVLAYLDVILAFGLVALLAIGGILLLVVLYQSQPLLTISLAVGAVIGGLYYSNKTEGGTSNERTEVPKSLKLLAVAIGVATFAVLVVATLGVYFFQEFIPNPKMVFGIGFGFLWGLFLVAVFSLMPGMKMAEMMGEVNLPKRWKIAFGVFVWWLFLFAVIFPVYWQIRQDGGVWGAWPYFIWSLGIAGFLLSWVWVFVRNSAARLSLVKKIMNTNELVIKSGIASVRYHAKPKRHLAEELPHSAKSWLYLTDQRLFVVSNQSVLREIGLRDIVKIEAQWSRIFGILPILPNAIEITTKSGATWACVVPSRQSWLVKLQMGVQRAAN